MSRITIIAITGMVCSAVLAADAVADDFATRFGQLRIGETRGAVTSIMGEPTSQLEENVLGVPRVRMRWVFGPRTYGATFVAGLLVSRRSCQAMPDC